MFELVIKNEYDKELNLSNNPDYYVLGLEGLASVGAEVFSQTLAFKHGSILKNSKVSERNLVLTIKLNNNIEQSRIALYDFFKPGDKTTLYFTNGVRNVFIETVVENIECDLFVENETMQISLIATNPFFKGLESKINISKSFDNFIFPFSLEETGVEFGGYNPYKNTNVINNGEVPTGCIIKALFNRETDGLTVYDYNSGKYFEVDYVFNAADELTINTIDKTVILTRDAENFNLISYKKLGSTWFELPYGVTTFTYNAKGNDEFVKIYVSVNPLFYGV
jgi:hypothetical protein